MVGFKCFRMCWTPPAKSNVLSQRRGQCVILLYILSYYCKILAPTLTDSKGVKWCPVTEYKGLIPLTLKVHPRYFEA
jgi:hypothetical protein